MLDIFRPEAIPSTLTDPLFCKEDWFFMTEGIFVFKYVQMVGKDKEDCSRNCGLEKTCIRKQKQKKLGARLNKYSHCVIFFLNLDYMESRAMEGFLAFLDNFFWILILNTQLKVEFSNNRVLKIICMDEQCPVFADELV